MAEAERLEGKRETGPQRAPTGLVIGQFTDLESALTGLALTGLALTGVAPNGVALTARAPATAQ